MSASDEFSIELTFVGRANGSPEEATTAELTIRAGDVKLTEVEDTIARSVRPYVRLPASEMAEWFLMNWWRLRWEPRRAAADWRESHHMAAIGGGNAWPRIEFASDGAMVRITSKAEDRPDVSAIRYLQAASISIPAREYEIAVDRMLEQVTSGLRLVAPQAASLSDLREELADERGDADKAVACRLQALAGIDPGSAPTGWLHDALALAKDLGPGAAAECVASAKLDDARAVVRAIQRSSTVLDISWISASTRAPVTLTDVRRPAWELGESLAREIRSGLGRPEGPLKLDELGVCLPKEHTRRPVRWGLGR